MTTNLKKKKHRRGLRWEEPHSLFYINFISYCFSMETKQQKAFRSRELMPDLKKKHNFDSFFVFFFFATIVKT